MLTIHTSRRHIVRDPHEELFKQLARRTSLVTAPTLCFFATWKEPGFFDIDARGFVTRRARDTSDATLPFFVRYNTTALALEIHTTDPAEQTPEHSKQVAGCFPVVYTDVFPLQRSHFFVPAVAVISAGSFVSLRVFTIEPYYARQHHRPLTVSAMGTSEVVLDYKCINECHGRGFATFYSPPAKISLQKLRYDEPRLVETFVDAKPGAPETKGDTAAEGKSGKDEEATEMDECDSESLVDMSPVMTERSVGMLPPDSTYNAVEELFQCDAPSSCSSVSSVPSVESSPDRARCATQLVDKSDDDGDVPSIAFRMRPLGDNDNDSDQTSRDSAPERPSKRAKSKFTIREVDDFTDFSDPDIVRRLLSSAIPLATTEIDFKQRRQLAIRDTSSSPEPAVSFRKRMRSAGAPLFQVNAPVDPMRVAVRIQL